MFMYNKTYHSAYHKKWYRTNKTARSKQIQRRKADLGVWLRELKSTLKCESCPENHPATLDFHHVDPNVKDSDLARTIRDGWSRERILKEIEKCKVLCSNCHRKLHW